LSNNANWLPIPPSNITFYSNVGASLAAFIVKRVAGMSYEKYVQDKILKPLGIDEKKGGYRLSNFQDNRKSLVDHYVYNASWLEAYQQMEPEMNISRVGFKQHQSKR
jgi:CubicO group peptidase (beta-lactamase class C family)